MSVPGRPKRQALDRQREGAPVNPPSIRRLQVAAGLSVVQRALLPWGLS
jgi:hypothetical protein